jgi:tRNA nucleotidyltransferase (CCA-adding enzyme)
MPNLAQLLTSKSSTEYQRVFQLCRDIANELGEVDGVYVVGGVVRDLILDREPGDIDLSVVGDAKVFAETLANRMGASNLVESQFLTYKIVIKNLDGLSEIDVVNARSETYAGPAALPDITPGSIDDDLKRRDFTINSMAISLNDSDWGTLFDPTNGFADTMRKRIKVHHDESYVVDPTRIFRTVRYAVRLGYSIDSRTIELISHTLDNIGRLSGARIRHEFELMLTEPNRVDILKKSEDLGLLAAISPSLRVGAKALQVLESQAEDGSISSQMTDLLAIATFGLNEDEAKQVVLRFDGPGDWGESILGNAALSKLVAVLDEPNIKPSEVAEILQPIPLASINAYIAAGPPLPRRDRMTDYITRIRFIQPEISGTDLLAEGIPEGPVIGKLMDVVRRAKLDGTVSTKQEELDLAKSRLPGFLTS